MDDNNLNQLTESDTGPGGDHGGAGPVGLDSDSGVVSVVPPASDLQPDVDIIDRQESGNQESKYYPGYEPPGIDGVSKITGAELVPGGRGGKIHPPFNSVTAAAAARARYDRAALAIRRGVALAGEQTAGVMRRNAYAMLVQIAKAHAAHALDAGARGSQTSFRTLLGAGWGVGENGRHNDSLEGGGPVTGEVETILQAFKLENPDEYNQMLERARAVVERNRQAGPVIDNDETQD